MSRRTASRLAPALLAIFAVVIGLAVLPGHGQTARAAAPSGNILMAWGVGGVLTDDGNLWQYRPESRKWVTVDQSFSLDGERRKVLPLPVAAQDIAHMQGFGFLITKAGVCWIYNLDENRWERIGAPGV